ncbi:MAG: methionine--tRNA ligase subunit beta [Planctomycetota bacterium]
MTEYRDTKSNPADKGAPTPAPQGPYDPRDELVSMEEFLRIKLRTAEVIEAKVHPNADKLLVLKVRVGTRVKELCAGIRRNYAPEALVGRRVIVVDNLRPAVLRGVESQGMLLAATDGADVVLLTTDRPDIPSGLSVR